MASANVDDELNRRLSHEVENQPAEIILRDYLLVPGVVTNCFHDHVVFQSSQTNELYELKYNQVRYAPNISPDLKFKAGDRVESLIHDSTLNVYGWATGTIKSFAGSTYVIAPDKRTGVYVVKQDKLRAITEPMYWKPMDECKIEILVPENLRELNELDELDYNQARYAPNISPDLNFQAGDRVESLIRDSTLNVYGWATGTIKSVAGSTYVIALDKRTGVYVVKQDKLRAITEPMYCKPMDECKIEILVPENLRELARDMENLKSLSIALENPHITYDAIKNAVVVHSPTPKCEENVKMVQTTFLENLRQQMLISRTFENLLDKYQKLIAAPLTAEFKVNPDVMKDIIGRKGKNIKKAQSIEGIIHIAVLDDSNTVKIFSETQEAVDEAYMYLNIAREFVDVPSKLTSQIIGRNASVVQSITDSSKLRRTVIHRIGTPEDQHVQLEFVGTPSDIESAKLALKFHTDNIVRLDKLAEERRKTKDKVSKSSTRNLSQLAAGSGITRNLQRVIYGRPFDDDRESNNDSTKKISTIETRKEREKSPRRKDQIFYNGKFSRGGETTFGNLRGSRANRGSRGRGFQNTSSRFNDSDSGNTTDESEEPPREVFGGYRGRRRGRGRGRGRLIDLQNPLSSSSGRRSLNDSSPNETQEPVREQPLIEAGDASNIEEDKVDTQRKQGAISRYYQQQKNDGMDEAGQGSEIEADLENVNCWSGKTWWPDK